MGRGARAGTGVLLLLAVGCGTGQPAAAPPAAEKPHVEADLARTTLDKDQYASLKIAVAEIVPEKVQERRACVAYIVPKPDEYVTIVAPSAGIVQPVDAAMPIPGQQVTGGKAVVQVQPIVGPLENIQVAVLKFGLENDLSKSLEKAKVAEAEVARLRQAVKDMLRGQQELDDAEARLQHAAADVKSATDKLKLFQKATPAGIELAAVPVVAPQTGEVAAVLVSPGQIVAANAPLLTVMNLDDPWLRVQVPETDLERVNQEEPLDIAFPIQPGEKKPRTTSAGFLALVPEVDRLKHTATILYSLSRPEGMTLAKDQMLTVYVPLKQEREETVVPYSAVIFDAYAGAWVYVRLSPDDAKKHVFERRRIELGPPLGKRVVIRPPLARGEKVVVEGVGELFSREFHRPPAPKAAKMDVDDDD